MKRTIKLIVYILIFSQFAGCLYQVNRDDYSSTYKFNKKVNELCFEQGVKIVTTDSIIYSGKYFHITDSTSTFLDQNTGIEKIIPTKNINTVSFKSFSSGILKSLTAGVFASIALLMLWETFKSDYYHHFPASMNGILILPLGPVTSFCVLAIDGYEIQININKTN